MISFNISSSHPKALSIFIHFKSLLSSSPIQVNVCVDFHLFKVIYFRLRDSRMMLPRVSLYSFSFDPLNSVEKSRSQEEKISFAYKLIFSIVSSRIASNYFNFNETVLESTKNRYSIAPIIEFHKISYKKFRYMEHLLRTRITSISQTIRR